MTPFDTWPERPGKTRFDSHAWSAHPAYDLLTLVSMQAEFTAYPFEERASFESKNPELAKIWEMSWRTARLDAHETYMNTPYWQQLQYVGDTQIQALISYAVTGDDRLANRRSRALMTRAFPKD